MWTVIVITIWSDPSYVPSKDAVRILSRGNAHTDRRPPPSVEALFIQPHRVVYYPRLATMPRLIDTLNIDQTFVRLSLSNIDFNRSSFHRLP